MNRSPDKPKSYKPEPSSSRERMINKRYNHLYAPLALAAGISIVFGVAHYTDDEVSFSHELDTHTMQPGETLWDVAQLVDGHDEVDTRDIITNIQGLVENQAVLDDGEGETVVRSGEQIYYPDHVQD